MRAPYLRELTQERLKEILRYNPETGEFFWVSTNSKKRLVGKPAGHLCKTWGYHVIGVDYRIYRAHRLAWLYVYGVWPDEEIDHINRDRSDNRIENLRLADRNLNCHNRTTKGASFDSRRGKWYARITDKGVTKWLGEFGTEEEAQNAYFREKEQYAKRSR